MAPADPRVLKLSAPKVLQPGKGNFTVTIRALDPMPWLKQYIVWLTFRREGKPDASFQVTGSSEGDPLAERYWNGEEIEGGRRSSRHAYLGDPRGSLVKIRVRYDVQPGTYEMELHAVLGSFNGKLIPWTCGTHRILVDAEAYSQRNARAADYFRRLLKADGEEYKRLRNELVSDESTLRGIRCCPSGTVDEQALHLILEAWMERPRGFQEGYRRFLYNKRSYYLADPKYLCQRFLAYVGGVTGVRALPLMVEYLWKSPSFSPFLPDTFEGDWHIRARKDYDPQQLKEQEEKHRPWRKIAAVELIRYYGNFVNPRLLWQFCLQRIEHETEEPVVDAMVNAAIALGRRDALRALQRRCLSDDPAAPRYLAALERMEKRLDRARQYVVRQSDKRKCFFIARAAPENPLLAMVDEWPTWEAEWLARRSLDAWDVGYESGARVFCSIISYPPLNEIRWSLHSIEKAKWRYATAFDTREVYRRVLRAAGTDLGSMLLAQLEYTEKRPPEELETTRLRTLVTRWRRVEIARGLKDYADPAMLQPLAGALAVERDRLVAEALRETMRELGGTELLNRAERSRDQDGISYMEEQMPLPADEMARKLWLSDNRRSSQELPTDEEDLIERIQKYGSTESIVTLAGIGPSEKAIPTLVKCLGAEWVDLLSNTRAIHAHRAACTLGRMGQKAMDQLIAALDSPDPTVRKNALKAMAFSELPGMLKFIHEGLADADEGVRQCAAWALGWLERTEDAHLLIRALQRDASGAVRGEAALSLGYIRSTEAAAALRRALADEHPDVRRRAAEALGMLRCTDAGEDLAIALQDSDEHVRRAAFFALRRTLPPSAVPELVGLLQDEDLQRREWAFRLLRETEHPDKIQLLTSALNDNTFKFRDDIARLLGLLGSEEARPALTTAARDRDWLVREAALRGLARIGLRQEDAGLVIGLLSDDNPLVRCAALEAAGRLPDFRVAVSAAISSLSDAGPYQLHKAEKVFKAVVNPDVAAALLQDLDERAEPVQMLILRLTATVRNPRVTKPLLAFAARADGAARELAMKTAVESASAEQLIEVLEKGTPEEKALAAKMAGKKRLGNAVRLLVPALRSRHPLLKQNALEALKRITSQDFDTPEKWEAWWKERQKQGPPRHRILPPPRVTPYPVAAAEREAGPLAA